jgi:hypothetical protein
VPGYNVYLRVTNEPQFHLVNEQMSSISITAKSLGLVFAIYYFRKELFCQVPVAHTCNPGYSGGRDQEDHGSKPTWANSSSRPYLEKPFTKIRLVE